MMLKTDIVTRTTLGYIYEAYKIEASPFQVMYQLRTNTTAEHASELELALYEDYIQARNGYNDEIADYVLKVLEAYKQFTSKA